MLPLNTGDILQFLLFTCLIIWLGTNMNQEETVSITQYESRIHLLEQEIQVLTREIGELAHQREQKLEEYKIAKDLHMRMDYEKKQQLQMEQNRFHLEMQNRKLQTNDLHILCRKKILGD